MGQERRRDRFLAPLKAIAHPSRSRSPSPEPSKQIQSASREKIAAKATPSQSRDNIVAKDLSVDDLKELPEKEQPVTARPSILSRSTSSEPSKQIQSASQDEIAAEATPAPSKDSVVAKDLWADALKELSEEDQLAISSLGRSKLDSIGYLLEAAERKKQECDDRKWIINVLGKRIVLRDLATKIISWINRFKEVGDVAVNFDPVHAALPWAGVRLLLEMAIIDSQQMASLLISLEKVTYLVNRCRIYELLYLRNQLEGDEIGKQATKSLESKLLNLYIDMLKSIAQALRLYGKNTTSRVVYGILHSEGATSFVDRCTMSESDVDREAQNCERALARLGRLESSDQGTRLRQILNGIKEPILRIDSQVSRMCAKIDGAERSEVLMWISSIPYKENHLTACEGRTSGTGSWLVKHERYLSWRGSSASTILWLHGSPGAGKTKLVSRAIDDMQKDLAQSSSNEALAYFYCDRNQADRRDPETLLGSLVRQLSITSDEETIQHLIYQQYEREHANGFASGKLRFEQSLSLFAQLVAVYPQVTLVIDALDECDEKTRAKLIDALDKLVHESPRPLKVFISSRPDGDIKHRFASGPNMEIKATDNRSDIAMFVEDRLANNIPWRWKEQITPALKAHISATLIDRSDGMFQWASLQLDQLFDLDLAQEIRKRLGRLPETLDQAYDEIYNQIRQQKGSKAAFAMRAFQWVMCSRRPLSSAELVAAVCQDPESDDLNDSDIDVDIEIVLQYCRNLLVVDQQLDVCKFSHLSVQEYFETRHWSQIEANCVVGTVCLSLLNHPTYQSRKVFPRQEECGRLDLVNHYARFHWAQHIQACEESDCSSRLARLLKSFLGSMLKSSPAYDNWLSAVKAYVDLEDGIEYLEDDFEDSEDDDTEDSEDDDIEDSEDHIFDPKIFEESFIEYNKLERYTPCASVPIHVLEFGLYTIISDWWSTTTFNVEQLNSQGERLLSIALRQGDLQVIQELLDRGADVSAHYGNSNRFGSALEAACCYGKIEAVFLLLEKGADVNMQGGPYGSALHAACFNGEIEVVLLLLEKGADVNVQGDYYSSALHAACFNGETEIVLLLLEKGANINMQGGRFGSALQASCLVGDMKLVLLLLEKGADVNVQGGQYGSALEAACYSGHTEVMLLLLEKGVDVNSQGGDFGSALQAACYIGKIEMVYLLLEKGADINAKGGHYGNALRAALQDDRPRNKEVVRLLLRSGADINSAGDLLEKAIQIRDEGSDADANIAT